MIRELKDKIITTLKGNKRFIMWLAIAFFAGIFVCGIAEYARGDQTPPYTAESVLAHPSENVWTGVVTPWGPAYVYGKADNSENYALIVFCSKHKGWHVGWLAEDGTMTIVDYVGPDSETTKAWVEAEYEKIYKGKGGLF